MLQVQRDWPEPGRGQDANPVPPPGQKLPWPTAMTLPMYTLSQPIAEYLILVQGREKIVCLAAISHRRARRLFGRIPVHRQTGPSALEATVFGLPTKQLPRPQRVSTPG